MFAFRRQSTWRTHKGHLRSGQYNTCCKLCRLTQYGNRCDWLKDDKFLRDLEGDSVDTEILDEELRSLQEDEPQTCRGKSVKFLESNPLQIVLCVLVLIDAGVVVAEILLDLHAIRGQYREANDQLHQVLDFIKDTHADDLHGYNGNNVGHILELLHGFEYNSSAAADSGSGAGSGSGLGSAERDRRDLFSLSDLLSLHLSPRLHGALLHGVDEMPDITRSTGAQQKGTSISSEEYQQYTGESHTPTSSSRANIGSSGIYTAKSPSSADPTGSSSSSGGGGGGGPANSYLQTAMHLLRENIHLKAEIAKIYSGLRGSVLLEPPPVGTGSDSAEDLDKEDLMVYRDLQDGSRARRDTPGHPGTPRDTPGHPSDSGNRHVVHRHNHKVNRTRGGGTAHHPANNNNNNNNADHFNSYASGGGESREDDFLYTGVARNSDYAAADDGRHKSVRTHAPTSGRHPPSAVNITHFDDFDDEDHAHTQAEKLKEIAHILHFCSIGILGIFVAQLFLKLFGMGITEFFKKKMEIFDAVIILASFALDLVFLEGIGGAQGEEAAALLIVFLLWRILRVINGIMVTAKKRQEFRIKLQKRARRRGDKKVELLEEDRSLKEKEIAALRELCARRGADEDEIKACKPRRKSKSIMPRMDTSMGLTSVASLSLSLSMSMSGGAFNSIARSNPILNRRDSIQDILPPQRHPRRSSLMSSKPIEILQNHFRGGDKSPRTSAAGSLFSKRLSMEKVVEEKEVENGGEELINKRNTVGDAIEEGNGEANLALLGPHGPPAADPAPPALTFHMENEVLEAAAAAAAAAAAGHHAAPAADRASLGTPSPSRSDHSPSNTSMANGPVRRASTSSRHSNKEPHEDVVLATPPGDVSVSSLHQGDVITHHNHQQQPLSDAAVAVSVMVPTSQCDDRSASPHRRDVRVLRDVSPHHDDVASHLNEVTMHLDDVSTRLDDVATHLTDILPIQEDEELSSSSDSEGHETTRL